MNWKDISISKNYKHDQSTKDLVINIVGDFCPINEVEIQYFKDREYDFYNGLKNVFDCADLNIVNLECPLTNYNTSIWKSGPAIKADVELINILKKGNFHLATLANNHILDYGEKGLHDTLEACNKHGITTVGAGLNEQESSQISYKKINNTTIAIINVCEQEFSIADNNSAGAQKFDHLMITKQLKNAKKNVDICMVIYHGGHEQYNLPSPRLQKVFRFIAEQGADIVIGHHSHTFSGIEIFNDVPLIYSLGNFIFPENTDYEPWFSSYILSVIVNEKKYLKLELYPFYQSKEVTGIRPMNLSEITCFENQFNKLNSIISDESQINSHWEDYCKTNSEMYLKCLYKPSLFNRVINKLFKKHRFRKRISPGELNILRNESHHEVLTTIFKNFNSPNSQDGYKS